jgi:uncharacterized damage-inducible protein DinB
MCWYPVGSRANAPSPPPPAGEELQGDKIQMKNILENYTSYNLWANAKLMGVLKSIDPSLLDKELKSSFATLRKTMHHIWGGQVIWLQRLSGTSLTEFPELLHDFSEFEKAFTASSQSFIDLAKEKDEKYFLRLCSYKAFVGTSYTNPHWEMIMHCMNHSTHHRGQIVTMLREVGITTIPSTDMMGYFRESK